MIRTVGFYGKSGTGKSYKALSVAGEKNIRLIVDDGLLICDHKILAGKSAKKEKTKYASTKRAIFMDENHAEEVRKAIIQSGMDSVMVIGTSDRMVNLIAERIGVAPVDEYIRIEDVSTDEERRIASVMRNEQGKHVIPLPTFEVKKSFSGYLLDPIGAIRKVTDELFGKNDESEERTIIRPTYSYLGDFEISENVLIQIARYEAENTEGVACVEKVVHSGGVSKHELRMDIRVLYGFDIRNIYNDIQKNISLSIDNITSIYIDAIHVNIVGIDTLK